MCVGFGWRTFLIHEKTVQMQRLEFPSVFRSIAAQTSATLRGVELASIKRKTDAFPFQILYFATLFSLSFSDVFHKRIKNF